jgi:hypothetical protein
MPNDKTMNPMHRENLGEPVDVVAGNGIWR